MLDNDFKLDTASRLSSLEKGQKNLESSQVSIVSDIKEIKSDIRKLLISKNYKTPSNLSKINFKILITFLSANIVVLGIIFKMIT